MQSLCVQGAWHIFRGVATWLHLNSDWLALVGAAIASTKAAPAQQRAQLQRLEGERRRRLRAPRGGPLAQRTTACCSVGQQMRSARRFKSAGFAIYESFLPLLWDTQRLHTSIANGSR